MFFGAVRYLFFGFFVCCIDFLCLRTRGFRRSAFVRKSFHVFVIYFLFGFLFGCIDFFCFHFGVSFSAVSFRCGICGGENAILGHTRGGIILSLGNMLG